MASWAQNSFVNLFFCNFKMNSWHFCSNQSINLINVSVWIHPKKCNFHLVFPELNISLVVKEQKTNRVIVNLQSRRNFGARVLSTSLAKIMAAIFDFNGSWRLYQGAVAGQK